MKCEYYHIIRQNVVICVTTLSIFNFIGSAGIKNKEMKKYLVPAARLFLLMNVMLTFTQCNSQATYHATINKILQRDVKEVKAAEAAKVNKTLFLDTRTPEEYKVSHIKNARFENYEDFNVSSLASVPRDTPIIVYCAVGYRSEKVTKKLTDAGFKNVTNLYGGIFEWVNNGYPVVDSNGPTKKVHAYNKIWGRWLVNADKVYK
jgi:rhodanese-related sulfurtransferase